jgi:hypothetical protein
MSESQEPNASPTRDAPDAGVGAPPRHYPVDERAAPDPDNPLPPNPNADTAYGPVRSIDPAHPDSSDE